MYNFIGILAILYFSVSICACVSKSSREPESNNQSINMQKTDEKITATLMGIDESIETHWVPVIPQEQDLTVLTGRIGITGSEPFLNVALYINNQESYLLKGGQKLMEYLTKKPHEKVTLAGKTYDADNNKWIKVMYVQSN